MILVKQFQRHFLIEIKMLYNFLIQFIIHRVVLSELILLKIAHYSVSLNL